MKNVLSGLFLILVSASCTTPTREPASDPKLDPRPVHHVFLIHGITGDQTHFGQMKAALTSQLAKLKPDVKFELNSFEYDTRSDTKDVFTFADDFNRHLGQYFSRRPLGPRDRLSVVAHSQGGIVTSVWLFRVFSGAPGYDRRLAAHVESFTTLGTPFWGSKLATFVKSTIDLGKSIGINVDPLQIYGNKQLLDMSFNSDVVYTFRKTLTSPEAAPTIAEMKNQVRILNVSGIVKTFSRYRIFGFMKHLSTGQKDYEDDGAVPLPSSRLDFLYADLGSGYSESQVASADVFKETAFAGFDVVDGLHFLPPPLDRVASTICQVPEACARNLDCGHPSFKHVVSNILNLPNRPRSNLTGQMTSFMIDVIVRASNGVTLEEAAVVPSFSSPKGVVLRERAELYSGGVSQLTKNGVKSEGPVRVYYMGYIDARAFPNRQAQVELTLRARGFKARKFNVPVRSTYTSFAEVALDPL